MTHISEDQDDLFDKAVRIVSQYDRASASLIQRTLQVGYARAARILDELEIAGIVGPGEGAKPRDILVRNAEDYLNNPSSYSLNRVKNPTPIYEPEKPTFKLIPLKDLPSSSDFRKIADSLDISSQDGEIIFGSREGAILHIDLEELGNLIVVGTSQSGKEKFLDTLILSLLYQNPSKYVSLVVADAHHDTDIYCNIPNLLTPVISEYFKFSSALKWAQAEIDRRYKLFDQYKIRSLNAYNEKVSQWLPRILFVIRNSEDFLLSWEDKEALERAISVGNKTGIHFIIFTDRLTAKSVSSLTQSNISNRLVFKTADKRDSTLAGVKNADDLIPIKEFILKVQSENEIKGNSLLIQEDEIRNILGF